MEVNSGAQLCFFCSFDLSNNQARNQAPGSGAQKSSLSSSSAPAVKKDGKEKSWKGLFLTVGRKISVKNPGALQIGAERERETRKRPLVVQEKKNVSFGNNKNEKGGNVSLE